MAKNSLISGSIWDEYSNQVVNRMNNPKHQGEITEERAAELGAKLIVADFGAESCGDAVRLYWAVEESSDRILESKFKSFGCGTAIASSDVMAELCIGKTVDQAVKITNIDVEFALRDNADTPAVPPQKMHCSVMAYDVIKKAAAEYKGVDMESFEQEQIICECARVSLATLKDVIKINKLIKSYGKNFRNRSGNHELLHVRDGSRRAGCVGELRGRPHHTVCRRVHEIRRAPRRPSRETPSDHEPGKHHFLGQALHGPQIRRGPRRGAPRAL